MRASSRFNKAAVLAALMATAVALPACTATQGGDDAGSEGLELYGHTIVADQELADRVPAEWKGGITVPVKVLQPNAYVDETGEVVGLQPDLVAAMAAKWGVDVTMEAVAFDGHVPGVMAGKYAFTASTGDHPQRREVLTLVDYLAAGVAYLTAADSDIETKDDICGRHIGVIKGTDQELRAEDKAAECDAAGIPGTTVTGFSNTLITVPLEAGRIDVAYDSVSYMLYMADTQPDQFRLVGDLEMVAPIAFGVENGQDDKVALLQETVQALMDDGVYDAIFAEWGQQELALDDAYVNQKGMPAL
ncbi:transporter substrate-binding domain-containing protein [uncultured Microbacterium sp.]|uniref:transporter substrate-binding domain-containing protein n=1 Tax=uncultured Microbacterium sp. TaxID=191216 RepID=UPI002618676F|nr:transporter substrate-binding domain-containing protein [uncultured Microbacterium sp.]